MSIKTNHIPKNLTKRNSKSRAKMEGPTQGHMTHNVADGMEEEGAST